MACLLGNGQIPMHAIPSLGPVFAGLISGVGLSSAFVAGAAASRATAGRACRSVPMLTLGCCTAIACVSLVQLVFEPLLLPLLMRDAVRVHAGQPWRLLTSLLVQDGGWPGFVFNLVGLLAIGTVAEWMLGRTRWVLVAMASVIAAQWVALAWQPLGAGNSIVNFGLAGAVCATCLLDRSARRTHLPAIAASACFVLLLAGHDIHGVAALAGALATFALSCIMRRRSGGGL